MIGIVSPAGALKLLKGEEVASLRRREGDFECILLTRTLTITAKIQGRSLLDLKFTY
jgi:hypothetical protein